MHFTIIGLGKLGAPIAAAIASRGHVVVGVDRDKSIVDKINAGIPPVREAYLQDAISEAAGNLTATTDLRSALIHADVVGVLVATPSKRDGTFSAEHVLKACHQIGKAIHDRESPILISVMSTIMPGTMRKEVVPALEKVTGKKRGCGWDVVYNPEFVATGNVVRSFLCPDVVIIGEDSGNAGAALAEWLLEILTVERHAIIRMPFGCAEIAKMAINTFVATKIAFANLVGDMCERYREGDVDLVTRAMGLDKRIGSRYLTAGPPYGGACFPRDVRAFEELADSLQLRGEIAWGVARANRIRVRDIRRKVEGDVGDTVAILGVAFKSGTACTDGSPSMLLADQLKKTGFRVVGWDPLVTSVEDMELWTLERCLMEADAIVIMNPEDQVIRLAPSCFARRKKPLFVLDCWRTFRRLLHDNSSLPHITYKGLGLR